MKLEFKPLTKKYWSDFETLFGERGACGGCWCMLWRSNRSEFERNKGAGNRRAMKALVAAGEIPGILAYADRVPVGWCSVAPRDKLPGLARSRILKKVDDAPVWSISCFFIEKKHRGRGISVELIAAAIEHVGRQAGTLLEAYPVEPKKKPAPPVFVWTGLASAFRKAGFKEVARRSPTRPVMRYLVANR